MAKDEEVEYISILISSTNSVIFIRSLILVYISKRSAL